MPIEPKDQPVPPSDTASSEPSESVGTKLLFENDRVRVWELALEPGEHVEKHVHRDDFLLIIATDGSLRHVDPRNPGNDRDVSFRANQVAFVEAGEGQVHDRLVNVGDSFYRNYIVELKQNKA
jgi:hypothetical protein